MRGGDILDIGDCYLVTQPFAILLSVKVASPFAIVSTAGTHSLPDSTVLKLLSAAKPVVARPTTNTKLIRCIFLKGITETAEGGLRIGALTTITDINKNRLIRELYPALSQAAAEVSSPQLRNQGTIGGNLCQKPRCWYYRGEFFCLRKGGEKCYAVAGENHYTAFWAATGVISSIPLTLHLHLLPIGQQSV
ncbi:MAG: FAD binding domain-containing protein [Thermodesulfovibrionales bacterium]